MLWFLLGDKRTGHFIVMIYKMIILDIVPFSIVTMVFLMMFSQVWTDASDLCGRFVPRA